MKKQRELVPVVRQRINNEEVNAVSARELHRFLEVGWDFSTWIKRRIDECGYRENQDYIIFPQFCGKLNANNSRRLDGRGRPTKEYIITLDMAKELCMLERNPKGRLARRYFIEMEKRARAGEKVQKALVILSSDSLGLETTTKVLFFRTCGLTQAETARALDISRDKVKSIEKRLKTVGVRVPRVAAKKRSMEWGMKLPSLLRRLVQAGWHHGTVCMDGEAQAKEALPC